MTITGTEFQKISGFIKDNFGIYLKEEKQSLLLGRLEAYLHQNNFQSFSEYYDFIVTDTSGNAVMTLVDRITTNHTYFMREGEHFSYLFEVVLPYFENALKDGDFRLWSAGCATGEEPYNIAFILEDFFRQKFGWDKKILATDISEGALSIAKRGVYSEKQIEPLPAKWKERYLESAGDGQFSVRAGIKNEVIFAPFNLVRDDFSFRKNFHVIFCRNVMIYFDRPTRLRLVEKFYEATAPGGYLFIGHSESLDPSESNYRYIMPAIYRKI